MARSKPRLYIRQFLNRSGHHTVASVLVSVSRHGVNCSISDCDRTIKLDFNGYRADEKKNSLFKVNRLIAVFILLREAMEAEFKANNNREDDY